MAIFFTIDGVRIVVILPIDGVGFFKFVFFSTWSLLARQNMTAFASLWHARA
jgi:hypothetical protein